MEQRTDPTTLPSNEEQTRILKSEQQRELPPSKKSVHYPDFSTIRDLSDYFKLSSDVFSDQAFIGPKHPKNILESGGSLIEKLKLAMLAKKEIDPELKKLLDGVYDYLSEEDPPQSTDLLYVFGKKELVRAKKAVELFKTGLYKKLVVSGRSPLYDDKREVSEADAAKELAVQNGVDEGDILVERTSISIPDGVRSTLNLLDTEGINFNSISIVNSPYAQRRGWVHFSKYLPDNVDIVRVNSDVDPNISRDRWFNNEEGLSLVLNEFVKMRNAVVTNTG